MVHFRWADRGFFSSCEGIPIHVVETSAELLKSLSVLHTSPFAGFFMAGFECSSHRRSDGLRLDLIRSTGHEGHALDDYRAKPLAEEPLRQSAAFPRRSDAQRQA